MTTGRINQVAIIEVDPRASSTPNKGRPERGASDPEKYNARAEPGQSAFPRNSSNEITFDCRAREVETPSDDGRTRTNVRTTQVLLNHSTDAASASRKRGERALVGETIDAHSRLPAEGIVTLAMTQRRVADPHRAGTDSSCDTD
jgi:hypothetical protein